MILKILGFLDILAAILFFLNSVFDKSNTWLPNKIIFIAGVYLLVKGIFFILTLDFASIIDVISGILIIISVYYPLYMILTSIVVILLLQKGIFSLVS
jgi:hypothetical protein